MKCHRGKKGFLVYPFTWLPILSLGGSENSRHSPPISLPFKAISICFAKMCCKSLMGICSLENWFRCVQSSREDGPWLRSRELSRTVAMARLSSVTGPPLGSWRNTSSSSSSTARSATGFLLVFLTQPTSTEMPRCCKALEFFSEMNTGGRSTQITAWGPSRGCKPTTNRTRASRRVSLFSSGARHDVV